MDDSNVEISDTKILLKTILQILEQKHSNYQKIIASGNQLISYDVKNISSGFGHGSVVYQLNLHFTKDHESETIYVALKVPGPQIYLQQKLKLDPNLPKEIEAQISLRVAAMHKSECFFYREISPFLKMKIPEIYETKDWHLGGEQGFILMEDLSENGIVLSKYDCVSANLVKAVVKEIAHFQNEYLQKSLKNDWSFVNERTQEVWGRIFEQCISLIPAMEDLIENAEEKEKFSKNLTKLIEFGGNKPYHRWAFYDAHHELGLPNVLVHGDLWNSNVVINKASMDSESPEIAAFIDWQLVCEGSPAADIARYLLLDTKAAVRRKIEVYIFQYYIDCFHAENPSIKFEESKIRKAYYISFIIQVFGVLIITVNNAKSLQICIENGEEVAENSAKRAQIIRQMIDGVEDAIRIMDFEIPDIVERFKYQK